MIWSFSRRALEAVAVRSVTRELQTAVRVLEFSDLEELFKAALEIKNSSFYQSCLMAVRAALGVSFIIVPRDADGWNQKATRSVKGDKCTVL